MTGALYVPGQSVLHRISAGWKLAGLCILGLLLFTTDWPPPLFVALAASVVVLLSTGVSIVQIRRQLTGPIVIIALLFLATGLLSSWPMAIAASLRLAALILAGYAVTLTTPISAFLDVIERLLAPLDRRGLVNAAHVALAVSLVFRFIPVIIDQARAIREAQAARGLERSIIALLIPLIVHVLKAADDIASAIDARSYPPMSISQAALPGGMRNSAEDLRS